MEYEPITSLKGDGSDSDIILMEGQTFCYRYEYVEKKLTNKIIGIIDVYSPEWTEFAEKWDDDFNYDDDDDDDDDEDEDE